MRLARQLSDERTRTHPVPRNAPTWRRTCTTRCSRRSHSSSARRSGAHGRARPAQERELRSWLYRPQGRQRGDLLSTAVDALAERDRAGASHAGRDRRRRRLPDRRRPPGRHGRLRRGADQRRQALRRAAGVAVRRGRSRRGDGLRPGPGEGVRPGDRPRGPARHRRLDPRPAPAARWDRGGRLVAGQRHGGSARRFRGARSDRPRRRRPCVHRGRPPPVPDRRAGRAGRGVRDRGRGRRRGRRGPRHRRGAARRGARGRAHAGGRGRGGRRGRRTNPPRRPVPCALGVDAAEDVIGVIRSGARGYVTKTISPDDLVDAVRRVHDGDAVFSPRLAGFVLDAFADTQPQCWTPSSTG